MRHQPEPARSAFYQASPIRHNQPHAHPSAARPAALAALALPLGNLAALCPADPRTADPGLLVSGNGFQYV
jgi:hypothetical protein